MTTTEAYNLSKTCAWGTLEEFFAFLCCKCTVSKMSFSIEKLIN